MVLKISEFGWGGALVAVAHGVCGVKARVPTRP